MKVGVFTALFAKQPFEEALDFICECGLEAVEIGTGNYPGSPHCDVDALLGSATRRKQFLGALEKRGLVLSGLSCHGNPLHPDRKFASAHHQTHRKTVDLAPKLGVDVVINFSGCPGDSERAKYPNWATCAWPPDYPEILKWQWEEKVIPYWKEEARYAKRRGVKLAFEMHPGFVVYNPESLLKLRDACGENIGANFDPSHLFWQGVDPVQAIRCLGDAIFHFHAKDTRLEPANVALNGVLDVKPYGDEFNRSWVFRTVGYGHGESVWRDIISALRLVNYDHVLSIEHEDSLMSINEGFKKAVEFLKNLVISEPRPQMWWA